MLLLAADTAYNDFPRVMFLLARDRFAPRPFLKMGDRLAFNNGILALSIVAGLVFFAFNGNTSSLIPLYAVGVFLAFTLSQAGMVVHWWRLRSGGWRRSILFNGIGCVLTAIVFVIAAVTKFTAGAWVSLLIVVVFTAVALLTRRHFDRVAAATGLSPEASASEQNEETPSQFSNLAIVPVPYLNRVTVRALAYAVSLGQPVLALHVSPTEEEAKRLVASQNCCKYPSGAVAIVVFGVWTRRHAKRLEQEAELAYPGLLDDDIGDTGASAPEAA